jgi:hypothetical protein
MDKIYELLSNEATRWSVMAILIFAVTFLFKYPYKRFLTDRIKNEKKRKLANKAIVLFTIALGIGLNFAYCAWIDFPFDVVELGNGIRNGLSAIALYSALEIRTKGAIENPFGNEDSQEVIEEVTALVTEKNAEKKTKKNKKDTTEKTAHEKFMDLVGQNNEN